MKKKDVLKLVEQLSVQHNIEEIELNWEKYIKDGLTTMSPSCIKLKPVLKIRFK